MRISKYNAGLLALAVGLASAAPAFAQNAEEDNQGGLGDIVVTAQKYEQKLQETPISIVAVDAEGLVSMGVNSLSGFDSFIPNVSIGGTMGQGNSMAAFSIRGIGGGASGFVTQESSVGVYIDDVLFARPNGALLDLLDIERLEVLRGPQGTLFGRNTAGGAIRYVTKKPEFNEVAGNVKVQIGSRSMFNVSGNLNVPLSDTLALRASFSKKGQDGFVTRLMDGDKAGDTNSSVGRVQLRWKPTDRLDVNLSGDWIRSQDDGNATITRGFSPTDLYPTALYANNAVGEQARRLVPATWLPNLNNNLTTGGSFAGYSTAAQDIAYYQDRVTDRYTVFGGSPELNKLKTYGLAATIAYDLTDSITVKSLTGYRNTKQIQNQDFDRTPLPLYQLNEKIDIEYVTQELQLVGSSFEDRLKWVVGGFYYWDHADDYRRRLGTSGNSDSLLSDTLAPLTAAQGRGLGELEQKLITTKSLAFFGQGTMQFTEALSVTAGLRWTEDQKDFTGFRETRGRVCLNSSGVPVGAPTSTVTCAVGFPGSTDASIQHGSKGKWQNWSPRFTVDYRWTPDVMTYVSASRGFKGGGFNDALSTRCPTNSLIVCGLSEFKPETLWTYEAGLRSDLFDRKVRFNLTAFLIKYRDLQIQYIDPGPPPVQYTLNGNSTVKGFEAEFMAAPTDGLLLRASVGYTDSKYDDDVRDGAGNVKIEKTVPYFRSPKWSYTLGASYSVPVRGDDDLAFDVNWGWKDTQASTAIPTNSVQMPSYGLLNGRIEYKSKAGWTLAVFGNNLTNTYYYTSAFDPAGPANKVSPGTTLPHDAVFGYAMLDLGKPREFGVELGYKF